MVYDIVELGQYTFPFGSLEVGTYDTIDGEIFPTPPSFTVTPESYPGLIFWFKADDLTLAESQSISTGTSSWFNHESSNVSASQPGTADIQPRYFNTKFPGGYPAVYFYNQQSATGCHLKLNTIYAWGTASFTLMALVHGNLPSGSQTGALLDVLGGSSAITVVGAASFEDGYNQFANAHRIAIADTVGDSCYSNVYYSNFTQAMVPCVVRTGSSCYFWDGKYTLGSAGWGLNIGFDTIGIDRLKYNAWTGSIAEICMWSGSLSSASIVNLYDNYWKIKYSKAGLYTA